MEPQGLWKATETFFPRWKFLRAHWPPSFWNGQNNQNTSQSWSSDQTEQFEGERVLVGDVAENSVITPPVLQRSCTQMKESWRRPTITPLFHQYIYIRVSRQKPEEKTLKNHTWSCWGKTFKMSLSLQETQFKKRWKFPVWVFSTMFEVTQEQFINSISTPKPGGGSIPCGRGVLTGTRSGRLVCVEGRAEEAQFENLIQVTQHLRLPTGQEPWGQATQECLPGPESWPEPNQRSL